MWRLPSVCVLSALASFGGVVPAVCAPAQTAKPFEEVVLPGRRHESHLAAYVTMATGAGLIGGSFAIRNRAQGRWDDYLSATDPAKISRLYDETVYMDRWSSGSLIVGEGLVALGLYMRFIRHASTDRVSLNVEPSRCALSLRF